MTVVVLLLGSVMIAVGGSHAQTADAMLRRFGLHAPPVWDTAVGGSRNRHAFSGTGRTLAGPTPLAGELDL